MKKLFKVAFMFAAAVFVAASLVACSSDDQLGVTPKPDNGGNTDGEAKKELSGPVPSSVEVKITYGHLHGYTGFHENVKLEGTTFIAQNPTFKFKLENNQWIADKNNPKYLYAFSSNKNFNSEAAAVYALDIHYFDANGKDITADMVADGKDEKLQHFFVPEDIKPLKDFDKTLDNPTNNDFFRYDYIDPTPFGKTMHSDGAKYNGLENPMGFKGYMSFGYCRQSFNLAIKLMEAKEKKAVNSKTLDFLTNKQIGKGEQNPREIASWIPTEEQEKSEMWYPTFRIPVMVYAFWGEYTGDVEMDEDNKLPEIKDLEPTTQRLIKTIKDNLEISEQEVLENLYYQVWGNANPEGGSYWF